MDRNKRVISLWQCGIIIALILFLQACAYAAEIAQSQKVEFYGSDNTVLKDYAFQGIFQIRIPLLKENEHIRVYLLTKDHKEPIETVWETKEEMQVTNIELLKSGLYQFALQYEKNGKWEKVIHSKPFTIIRLEDYATWHIDTSDSYTCHMEIETKKQANMEFQFCEVDRAICKVPDVDWNDDKKTIDFHEPGKWQLFVLWSSQDITLSKRYETVYELLPKPPKITMKVDGIDMRETSLPIQNHKVDIDLEVSGDVDKIDVLINDVKADVAWKMQETNTASISLSLDGTYVIEVCAVYNEDQTCAQSKTLVIDQTPPFVAIANVRPLYSSEVQLQMVISETHIQDSDIHIEVIKDKKVINDWHPTIHHTSYGRNVTLSFDQDGDYVLSFHIKDQSGNQTEVIHNELFLPIKQPIKFTIDQKTPELTITRSSQKAVVNQPIKIKTRAQDAHLKSLEIELYRNDVLIQKQLYKESKNAVFTWECDKDGQYRITAIAKDKAGWINRKEDTFIIDQTPPKLHVLFNDLPVRNHQRYISNQNVNVFLQWKDDTKSEANIQIMKNNANIEMLHAKKDVTIPIRIQKGKEDAYQLHIEVQDEAGNVSKATYLIQMDAYLPKLRFENDPFQGRPRNISWRPKLDQEGSAFHVIDVDLFRNQRLLPSYQWPDVIDQEGSYHLSVIVRDAAMNEAAYLPPFAFVIDRTPPSIRIVEDRRLEELAENTVSKDTRLRIYLEDQYSKRLTIHALTLNHQDLQKQVLRQDENNQAYYLITFAQAMDHTLFIDVSDEAGNHLKETRMFYVLEDLKQEDVKTIPGRTILKTEKNPILRYGAVVLGLMGGILLFCFAWRKYAP